MGRFKKKVDLSKLTPVLKSLFGRHRDNLGIMENTICAQRAVIDIIKTENANLKGGVDDHFKVSGIVGFNTLDDIMSILQGQVMCAGIEFGNIEDMIFNIIELIQDRRTRKVLKSAIEDYECNNCVPMHNESMHTHVTQLQDTINTLQGKINELEKWHPRDKHDTAEISHFEDIKKERTRLENIRKQNINDLNKTDTDRRPAVQSSKANYVDSSDDVGALPLIENTKKDTRRSGTSQHQTRKRSVQATGASESLTDDYLDIETVKLMEEICDFHQKVVREIDNIISKMDGSFDIRNESPNPDVFKSLYNLMVFAENIVSISSYVKRYKEIGQMVKQMQECIPNAIKLPKKRSTKKQKPVVLQLYHRRNDPVMMKLVEDIDKQIKQLLKKDKIKGTIGHCNEPGKLKADIPVLVLCINEARSTSDCKVAIKGINLKDQTHTALIVFCHIEKSFSPRPGAIVGVQIDDIDSTHHMAFTVQDGVYECKENTDAMNDIVSFIKLTKVATM